MANAKNKSSGIHSATGTRFLRPEIVRKISRLDLRAKLLADGFLQGLHLSDKYGFSSEFSDYREYVAGDDPSYIDWRLYARTDKYYIKRFQAETNTRCTLLVDCSASMHYSSNPAHHMSKLEYSVALAASLGYLLVRQKDRVGLMTLDTKVRSYVPPGSRRQHLMRILNELMGISPTEPTQLSSALIKAQGLIRKKGLVVLFSDLLEKPKGVIKALRGIKYRGQDVIVFQILDPRELRLNFHGEQLLTDPESGRIISTNVDSIRAEYLTRLKNHIRTLRHGLRSAGIQHLLLDTSRPYEKALLKFLLFRRRRS